MQDRAQRRNILIGLLLMAGAVGGALLMAPRTEAPVTVAKRPGPDKPPLPMPPPPQLQKADLDASIATLDQWLSATAAQTAATPSSDVALLLYALRGLGPAHDLKGKTTRQALLERLPTALMLQDGKPLLSPLQAELPELAVLATLLEADVPLDQSLLPNVTVGTWLEQARKAPTAVANAADWYSRNWLIDVLAIAVGREVDPPSSEAAREQLHGFIAAGFDVLSQAHRVFGTWAGQGPHVALQSRDSVEQLRQQQLGPYAFEGWGLPLAHSVLRAVVTLNQASGASDESLDEASRQLLGQLVLRQLFERQLWAPSKNPLPTSNPVDQLAYCGRQLEALAWTRLAIDTANDDGPTKIGSALRDCAQSISDVIVPLRLNSPTASPTQLSETQTAEVRRLAEAVSQALRGLRMVRRAYWPTPPKSAPPQ
ncbi:MAG TPA: hypothetical protein VHO25_15590 [Polyangiaceae bacterium]|nr:hypothetical protein [Polyangiaceae bacterium]